MNFDAFWQTHRRFLMAVAAGLVVFLIVEAVIGATTRSDLLAAERRIRADRAKLGQRKYDAKAENEVRVRLEELEQRVQAVAAEALPPWREDFRPQPGQSPAQFYIERTGRLRQELVPWVNRANVDVDESLGMPPVSPTEPQKIERVLRGLDVVDRVVRMAVSLGARAVEDIDISIRATSRRGVAGKAAVLDLTPVTLTAVMAEGQAFAFLLELTRAQPPLGLVKLEVGPLDERRHQRRITIELSVGEVPVASAEEQG